MSRLTRGWVLDVFCKIIIRLRALIYSLLYGLPFRKFGYANKIRGAEFINCKGGFSVGDFCWIEAVRSYAGIRYTPAINIGANVALSDSVHVSAISRIDIGDGCLLGSRIYIGDHSHGSMKRLIEEHMIPPARRLLGDSSHIYIGNNVWVCDGCVILAGTVIADGSIIAANSVVKLQCDQPALIAGSPAKIVRYLK